jgi:hypothetical protein
MPVRLQQEAIDDGLEAVPKGTTNAVRNWMSRANRISLALRMGFLHAIPHRWLQSQRQVLTG